MTDKKNDPSGFANIFQKAVESAKKASEAPPAREATEEFPGRNDIPTFTNQFYLSVGPHTARLTFGEYAFNGQIPNWNYTTVMTTPVAVDLARKIFKLARDQGISTEDPQEPEVLG